MEIHPKGHAVEGMRKEVHKHMCQVSEEDPSNTSSRGHPKCVDGILLMVS